MTFPEFFEKMGSSVLEAEKAAMRNLEDQKRGTFASTFIHPRRRRGLVGSNEQQVSDRVSMISLPETRVRLEDYQKWAAEQAKRLEAETNALVIDYSRKSPPQVTPKETTSSPPIPLKKRPAARWEVINESSLAESAESKKRRTEQDEDFKDWKVIENWLKGLTEKHGVCVVTRRRHQRMHIARRHPVRAMHTHQRHPEVLFLLADLTDLEPHNSIPQKHPVYRC